MKTRCQVHCAFPKPMFKAEVVDICQHHCLPVNLQARLTAQAEKHTARIQELETSVADLQKEAQQLAQDASDQQVRTWLCCQLAVADAVAVTPCH